MLPALPIPTDRCLIGGTWHTAAETLPAINPSDGRELGRIARGQGEEVDDLVGAHAELLDHAFAIHDTVFHGVDQLDVCLMYELSRQQRVIGALPAQVGGRDPAQLLID